MKKPPAPGAFLDDEEKEIIEAVERDDYRVGPGALTPERLKSLRAAARATIHEERARVSLSLPKTDLERLKARALREGLPWQTLVNSILHKAVSN